MRLLSMFSRVIVIFSMILLSACAAGPTPEAATATAVPTAAPTSVPTIVPTAVPTIEPSPTPESPQKDFEDFDLNNFDDHSANVDNNWFPLKPGTQFVYDGETIENGGKVPHRIVITVTDLTKVIGGIRSVITWDRDFSSGDLVEAELAFFAQDKDGLVWRMGEYPEEYENGKFLKAPTWIHGFQDARAGYAMQANPQLNTPSYSEGWGPAVDWTDRGQVNQMGQKICVPFKCYENVLVIAEGSKSEPGAVQLKYYAPGVGNILTDWLGTDVSKEKLEMTKLVQLSPEAMADARAQALKLETHAYEVSQDMYVNISPAEYPQGTPAISVKPMQTPGASNVKLSASSADEIVVYASDLLDIPLIDFDMMNDPDSPGGKLIGLTNEGKVLDPPPADDPYITFKVQVLAAVPYRCWIHMKVGDPMGKSQANLLWAQFSNAIDQANQPVLQPGSSSYLTIQGPQQTGWAWVGCNVSGAASSLVSFKSAGEVTVRLQAGMEGVGFDQFVLSSADFLNEPPSNPVVAK